MKKLTLLLAMLLLISILFSACLADEPDPSVQLNGTNPPETQETELPSQGIESTEPPTQSQPTDPKTGLPVHVPGSIELQDLSDKFPFERKYRACYYLFHGAFQGLLNEEQLADFHAWRNEVKEEINYGEFIEEMLLVSVIKRYDISREDFDRALEEYISLTGPYALKYEWSEPPNGDIIYTFDNEIINEYYRYE